MESIQCIIHGNEILIGERKECFLDNVALTDINTYINYTAPVIMPIEGRVTRGNILSVSIKECRSGGECSIYMKPVEEVIGFTVVNDKLIIIPPKFYPLHKLGEEVDYVELVRLFYNFIHYTLIENPSLINDNIWVRLGSLGTRGFYEILFYLYTNLLYDELMKGAYREYVKRISEEERIRGRILFARQVRKHELRQHIISLQYLDNSTDNLLNRVLKLAVQIVYNRTNIREVRSLSSRILSIYDDVVSIKPTSMISYTVFNRLSQRFKIPYDLALMIIKGLGSSRRRIAPGYFIRSDQLFQHYVYRALKEYLGARYIVEEEVDIGKLIREDSSSKVREKPDICIRESSNRGLLLCLDTKYKSLCSNGKPLYPDPNDIRQAYVYLRLSRKINPRINSVVLIYPYYKGYFNDCIFKEDNLIREYIFAIDENVDLKLVVAGFPLNHLISGDKSEIDAFIEIIKGLLDHV